MEATAVPATPSSVPQPSAYADAGLVARAQAGEAGAFETLYRQHVGRIYAVCLRFAGNATVAEECTQDAFVMAWESLAGFRGASAFGTWLHRIAVNAVLARHRTRLRQAAWVQPLGDDELEVLPDPRDTQHMALDLEQAIAGLPPGAREIFVLHDVEGYLHEEIAAATGLAVGTCKAQLHRARRLLRARLNT